MTVGKVKCSKSMKPKLGEIPNLRILYLESENHQTSGQIVPAFNERDINSPHIVIVEWSRSDMYSPLHRWQHPLKLVGTWRQSFFPFTPLSFGSAPGHQILV